MCITKCIPKSFHLSTFSNATVPREITFVVTSADVRHVDPCWSVLKSCHIDRSTCGGACWSASLARWSMYLVSREAHLPHLLIYLKLLARLPPFLSASCDIKHFWTKSSTSGARKDSWKSGHTWETKRAKGCKKTDNRGWKMLKMCM